MKGNTLSLGSRLQADIYMKGVSPNLLKSSNIVELQLLEQAWDHTNLVPAKGSSSHPGLVFIKSDQVQDMEV